MSTNLTLWLAEATPEERQQLAELAGTGVNYLSQLSGGHRSASPELARELERAAAAVRKQRSPKARALLPVLLRTDLNAACRGCEFAEKCLGQAVVASEFRMLDGEG